MGTLGVSGASLAMGLLHASSLSFLNKEVEEIKKSMGPDAKSESSNNVSLFGDMEEVVGDVDPSATPIRQIDATIGELETSMTVLSKLPNAIKNLGTSVETGKTSVSKLETNISNTTESIQPLIDVAPKVQSGILQFKSFSSNARVTDDGQFSAEDCNIGFVGNKGDKSALHFMGNSNDKWVMYMAGPSGKGPSQPSGDGTPSMGEVPPPHAGVTGEALRMRVGGLAGEGIIVENSQRTGLFSVGNNGRMTADATVVGDIDETTVGIAHVGKLTRERFAVSQDKEGLTRANAIAGQQLQLCVGGTPKVWVDELGTMVVKNKTGTSNTVFNSKGSNIIVAKQGFSTRFRAGNSTTDELTVGESGAVVRSSLSINGTNLINAIAAIETRLNAMDGQTSSSTDGQSTTSATIIATPEPFDHPPVTITNNTKIALKSVYSGKYLWVESNGNIRIDAPHTENSDIHFTIETQDQTANVSDNNRVLLKDVRYGKYLTHVSGYELKATGTSKLSTSAHFMVSNIERTSPIKEGDTIVFMTIGGNNHITIVPSTSRFTTNGGGRLESTAQFVVEVI